MAELMDMLTKIGFQDVKSYIQSGNVILKSDEESIQKIEDTISSSIENHFGFVVSVSVKTRQNSM